jgi:hypothetical protein
VPERLTSWRTFLQAHWGEIAGAEFFTTEVWTWRDLVTCYTVFVIELASRRVQILGSTPHRDEAFMRQVARTVTPAGGQVYTVLICDRDAKWSEAVRARLQEAGLRVIQTRIARRMRTPTLNASFARSRRNVSIASFRSANATFVGPSRSLWPISSRTGSSGPGQRID